MLDILTQKISQRNSTSKRRSENKQNPFIIKLPKININRKLLQKVANKLQQTLLSKSLKRKPKVFINRKLLLRKLKTKPKELIQNT